MPNPSVGPTQINLNYQVDYGTWQDYTVPVDFGPSTVVLVNRAEKLTAQGAEHRFFLNLARQDSSSI